MKPKTTTNKAILAFALFLTCIGHQSLAQESDYLYGSIDVVDEGDNVVDETTVPNESGDPIVTEEKKNSSKPKVSPKSTTSKKVITKKVTVKPKTNPDQAHIPNNAEADESVLSFNFLHYFIQRYKFSEVVED